MKNNWPLYTILALALVLRLAFAFSWHEVWWDSGVYIGMGKFMFSAGHSGLWEHIRPPLVPFVLGFFWSLGLDAVLFGRLFEIILFCGIVWLSYLLAFEWFGERTALLASLIVALSPIFFYLSFHQYTEIPATFFVLLSLLLFVRNQFVWSGLIAGIAFLSKLNAGIFIAILLIVALVDKKWKSASHLFSGFCIPAIPYFLWSWIVYGSPLATSIAAKEAINSVLGCNVLRLNPWWQYFWWLVFSEATLYFAGIVGLFVLFKKWSRKWLLFSLCLIIPLVYHSQMHCRDYRYLTLFLPFFAILSALGVVWLCDKFKVRKTAFFIILVLLGALMLRTSLLYYYNNEVQTPDVVAEEYFAFLKAAPSGEVWTANPIIAAHTDSRLEKIYYPIFDEGLLRDFYDYVSSHSDRISYVFLDNCGGGIMCKPGENCNTEQLQVLLDSKFNRVFDKQSGTCWYRIWTNVKKPV